MSGISTDQVFIQKLTEIIQANMAYENFGVDELARISGMSRSVIHRRLQSVLKKSTTQYIREVRLQRAMEMLRHESTTASEVAYKVGFSSPAYFNTCFHEFYGFPPGEVLRNGLRESIPDEDPVIRERKLLDPEIHKYEPRQNNHKQPGWHITGRHLIIYGIVGLFFIFGFSYLLNITLFENNNPVAHSLDKFKDKSISVLPFKGINIGEEIPYFAEGVTKDIIQTLVQIRELKVVTGFPMKEYNEEPMNIPLIAKKLEVRYLLVGSVQKQGSQVNVTVLLIDASQNRYVWSKEYIREFSDLFLIQSSIAKNVANNLQTVLTPADITQIEKIPTHNMEAYSNYLKGRYYLNKGNSKEIDKSREFFERAIKADSTFADAYAGMADYLVNCYKRNSCPRQEAHEQAKNFVTRALDLNNNLAEAHAIMGEILRDEWKWDEAREEFQQAIKLNYNCSVAHMYYSGLLRILKHNEESRIEINLAAQLNPTNPNVYLQSARLFWNEGKSEEALEECRKVIELDSTCYSVYWAYFNIYLRIGQKQKAVESLQKALSILPEDKKYVNMVKEYYDKQGIEGLPKVVIYINSDNNESGIMGTARFYNFLGDKNKALDYLEKAVELHLPGAPFMNNDIDLSTLYSEKRFLALIKKMGLSAYRNIISVNSPED